MFGEAVQNDGDLLDILEPDLCFLCHVLSEKIQNFYCSWHKVNFCRECFRIGHRDYNCFVVDLNDIKKLFQLNVQISYKNYLIIKTRSRMKWTKIEKGRIFYCELLMRRSLLCADNTRLFLIIWLIYYIIIKSLFG